MARYSLDERAACKVAEWLKAGRGVKVWSCIDLSNAGAHSLTPGDAEQKPGWQFANDPVHTFGKAEDFEVKVAKEVKRFRVGLQRGCGLSVMLTDGATRNVKKWKDRFEGSWHVFDYATQECVIMQPVETVPMEEWLKRKEPK